MNLPPRKPIPFDHPATYQIRVQGCIDPNLSDLLGGMEISQGKGNEDPLITILEGELSDQAALAGMLNTLYELKMPVILVRRLEIRP